MTTRISRRWVSIAVIALAAGVLAACGGPPAPSAWSGLAVSGQTAYLTATDRVYALDTNVDTPNARRVKWAFPPPDQSAGVTFHGQPIAADNGILYTGSDSFSGKGGYIFAFETATGAGKWRYPGLSATGENLPGLGNIYGGVAYGNSAVYAGTDDGHVVSVNAASGELNWVFTSTERIWSTPVVSGSLVYAASQNHNLYALDVKTGSEVWKFEAGALLAGTPTVYGDTVYVGSFDQKLYAVSAATGAKKWEFAAQGWLWDGPLVFDNLLYLGDLSGNLYGSQRTNLLNQSEKASAELKAAQQQVAALEEEGRRSRFRP